MIKLSPLFLSLVLSILLSACATMQVSDFRIYVQLPASGDCFGLNVVSKQTVRVPKNQCEQIVKRGIILTSDNYRMIREDIQANCQQYQCAQLTGRFDALFLAIDKGLQEIP